MFPVLFAVGRVDDDEEFSFRVIKVGIIDHPSVFVGNQGVLGLPWFQQGGIVRQHPLQKCHCIPTFHSETPHMADIEQASTPTGCQMFREDSICILDRHVPTAERNHLPPVFTMPGMEGSF